MDPLFYLRQAMDKWTLGTSCPVFVLQQISEIYTLELIKQLGNGMSMARDKIDSQSIKLACTHLYKPICHLINKSISLGIFCNKWKIAKVVPLHKGKGKSWFKPDSFRPISLLPVCTVQRQIKKYINYIKQLSWVNHAYKTSMEH